VRGAGKGEMGGAEPVMVGSISGWFWLKILAGIKVDHFLRFGLP
jgi:hypothetical protein